MSELRSGDRGLLGPAGLAMSEADYVQAIAGMGRVVFTWTPAVAGLKGVIGWSPDVFERNRKRVGTKSLGPSHFATDWRKKTTGSARIAITRGTRTNGPNRLSIIRILSRALVDHPEPQKSVFLAWSLPNASFRWEWPLRVAALADETSAINLEPLQSMWPAKVLMRLQSAEREDPRSEVLVIAGAAREALRRVLALRHRTRAGHVFVRGPHDVGWPELQGQLIAVLSETQAAAVSLVQQRSTLAETFNTWLRELSHDIPYDVALWRAFPDGLHVLDPRIVAAASLPIAARSVGRRLRRAAPRGPLEVPRAALENVDVRWTPVEPPARLGRIFLRRARTLPYDSEVRGATAISEVANAERSSRRAAASEESVRVLQADLFAVGTDGIIAETRRFVAGRAYRLEVFIAPEGAGALSADKPFPDADLHWDRSDRFTLKVLFSEPGQWAVPLRGTLELTRFGSSTRCAFDFTPTKPGRFIGRVTIHFRGRVLQTALLETVVAKNVAALDDQKGLRFRIETILRGSLGTLDDRRRFDACLLFNESASGKSTMQAAADDGAYIADIEELKKPLQNINGLLNKVALNGRDYSGGLATEETANLFCALAAEGNVLYRKLVLDYVEESEAATAIREGEYLQLVSAKPDAVVPLEFVYEYKPPAATSPVCPNAAHALRDGRCPTTCLPKSAPAPHVCPMGFWGLRKVIERHVHDPKLAKPARIDVEPISGRDSLTLDGACIVAASKQVDDVSRRALEAQVKTAWNGRVVTPVGTWAEWRKAVSDHGPVLLLALPHAGGDDANITLEIRGDVVRSIDIEEEYVRRAKTDWPLVLLMGCDMASAAYTDAYARHISVFRQAKAALVLGTIATVFGNDVAKVAGMLVTSLGTASGSSERFGEIMRAVKRQAVADSLPVALCLVAFGDADWRIAPRRSP